LILGPEDLEKTGKTVGKWINKLTKSEGWMAITTISREIRGLPARLAREAELDNLREEFDFDNQIGSTPLFNEPTTKKSADDSSGEETAAKPAEAEELYRDAQDTIGKEKSE
jgi:hypothetical protein